MNVICLNTARRFSPLEQACDVLKETFLTFYRRGVRYGKVSVHATLDGEIRAAVEAVGAFGFWRQLQVPEVGDTRWVAHERAAATVIRILPGVWAALCRLKDEHEAKNELIGEHEMVLQRGYRNTDVLFSIFLLAETCPILKRFSKSVQRQDCSFSDVLSIRRYFVDMLKRLRDSAPENTNGFVKYWASFEVIKKAGITVDVSLESLKSYHEAVGKPYLTALVDTILGNMADNEVLTYFSAYDPGSEAFKDAARAFAHAPVAAAPAAPPAPAAAAGNAQLDALLAQQAVLEQQIAALQAQPPPPPAPQNDEGDDEGRKALRALCRHFATAKPPLHNLEFGGHPKPTPSPPLWDASWQQGILSEYESAVGIVLAEGCKTFGDVVSVLASGRHAVTHPWTARVMQLAAVLPLTSSSVERLFSKLRLVSTRLRKLDDDSTNNVLFLGVEGAWEEGVGIPPDVLEKYIIRFLSRNDRAEKYATLREYLACRDVVMHWRDRECMAAFKRDAATQVTPDDISFSGCL